MVQILTILRPFKVTEFLYTHRHFTRLSSIVLQSINQAESSDLLPFPLIIFEKDKEDKSLKSSVKAMKSSLINQ